MADQPLPLLRGKIESAEVFVTTRGGGGDRPAFPSHDPAKHRAGLVAQLDHIAREVKDRKPDARDPEAVREIVAVVPLPQTELREESLAHRATDVRLVGRDPDTGTVLLDAKSAELATLRQKIEQYGDSSVLTLNKHPRHEPLVAPIHEVRRASLADVADVAVQTVDRSTAHWVEIGCRGGVYQKEEAARSKRELTRQLPRIDRGLRIAAEFHATGQTIFYVKATVAQVGALLDLVDCVYEVHLAEPKIRDWLLLDHDDHDVAGHALTPPPPDAPSIVVIDTGVMPTHPLLATALLSVDSVVPGLASGVDIDGHGTQMSGIALHHDAVGDAAIAGSSVASHWIQAVKIFSRTAQTADEQERAIWPVMTTEAVAKAEVPSGPAARVFAMAITAPMDPVAPTTWSQAVDQLAHNEGRGRVICVAAGNAQSNDVNVINGYPQLNLRENIEDPAQAWNALTVGAYTARDQIPSEPGLKGYAPVAPAGGVSPHTSSRPLDADRVPNKPEVVFEGGNVAFDGALPDATVPTLTTLTTGHRPKHQLASLWGTSDATARAAHLAASIWRADPKLRPETVRGLIVHAATWTENMEEQFESLDDRLRICGYGVPDAAFATHCARERATIIIEDAMPNAVMVEKKRKEPPKRSTTPETKAEPEHIAKFFRLPIDDRMLVDHAEDVELRVTLSYLAEVQTYRRRAVRGLDLRWDMQGPQEGEDAFRWRVNKRVREQSATKWKTKTFKWEIGPERREHGTVQSDRWTGPASYLAGQRLIAVMPVTGWWHSYVGFMTKAMPFSLIVTVRTPGLDIYTPIQVALEPSISVMV